MDPPVAPDTRSPKSPRHSHDPQPRLLSQMLGRLALPPSGPRFPRFSDRKRKEHSEPPVGSEEYKRRKFPQSNMVAQINGDGYIDSDEEKEKKWMLGELSRLQAEVEGHKRKNQDSFFYFLQEQQRRGKAEANLRLEQVRNAHNLAAWQQDLKTAKEDLQRERIARQRAQAAQAAQIRAQAATEGLHAEIEHLQEVNATIMSDLDELRGIENEAATKRRDDHLGLPPAYGNLDDEERFPPYSTHEDGGTVEVAHLKRGIRQRFELIVTRALGSEREKRSKLELLGTLAGGLNEACDSLQKLLDIAPKVPVSCARKPFGYGGYIDLQLRSLVDSVREEGDCSTNRSIKFEHPKVMDQIFRGPAHTYLPGYSIIQKENSAPYVADRIAKLLLELLWRCAAACEVRPGAGTLPLNAVRGSELITSIMLQFTQVDSVLAKALQLAFSRGISTAKLQHYLTQLERLSKLFKSELYEHAAAHRQFFGKATEWLGEQVEKTRSLSEIEAFKLRHPELSGEHENEDDNVSSRWQGSDTGSEDGSGEDDLENNEDVTGDEHKVKDGGDEQ